MNSIVLLFAWLISLFASVFFFNLFIDSIVIRPSPSEIERTATEGEK